MIPMGSLNPLLGLPDSPPPTALCTTWNQMKLPFQCSKALGILRGESWGKTEHFWSYVICTRREKTSPFLFPAELIENSAFSPVVLNLLSH